MLGYIQPLNLVEWVENTAPFVFLPTAPVSPASLLDLRYDEILTAVKHGYVWPEDKAAYVEDYFALCLAAHHATVATYIPTDVDSKIRGLLWKENPSPAGHERMFTFTRAMMRWPLDGVSRRHTSLTGQGPVSGHNGEQLSVLMGALQTFRKQGNAQYAECARAAVDEELQREAREFLHAYETRGLEIEALCLAAWLTHNAGDVDQGLSYWPKSPEYEEPKRSFGRLAHENTKPYGGAFALAAGIYKRVMAPEGHRNYPLRSIKALRQSPELLLPQAPFLDDYGARLARSPLLTDADRAELASALVTGARKLAGQRGYYRALAGMRTELGEAGMTKILKLAPNSVRKEYEGAELRKLVAVPRESFESSLKKMLRV
ncbi:MAG: hypothetical protein OHK0021_24990 [Bryobacter sp.]